MPYNSRPDAPPATYVGVVNATANIAAQTAQSTDMTSQVNGTALPTNRPLLRLVATNTGTVACFIHFGTAAQTTAAAAKIPVLAGSQVIIDAWNLVGIDETDPEIGYDTTVDGQALSLEGQY